MANTFKNAALANVSNSSYQTLYTTPAATQTVILGLAIANKTTAAIAGQPNTAPFGASPLLRASSLRRGVAGRVRPPAAVPDRVL